MLRRPAVSGIDAVTTLRHFAIVTYAVPPERLRPLVHPRFDLDCVAIDNRVRALFSAVVFEDQDFRAAAWPSPRWAFGQTNYRIYVRDRHTGCRAVWFLGTTLGSWSVALPKYLWRLPWHHGRFEMDCVDDASGRYSKFRMRTESAWAPAMLDLEHRGGLPVLPGFPDVETGLVVLTHPLTGFYTRTDATLGSYAVWHDRLTPTSGRVREARWGLLDRLGIVPYDEQTTPHSVLIQPRTEFIVHLPPRRVSV